MSIREMCVLPLATSVVGRRHGVGRRTFASSFEETSSWLPSPNQSWRRSNKVAGVVNNRDLVDRRAGDWGGREFRDWPIARRRDPGTTWCIRPPSSHWNSKPAEKADQGQHLLWTETPSGRKPTGTRSSREGKSSWRPTTPRSIVRVTKGTADACCVSTTKDGKFLWQLTREKLSKGVRSAGSRHLLDAGGRRQPAVAGH